VGITDSLETKRKRVGVESSHNHDKTSNRFLRTSTIDANNKKKNNTADKTFIIVCPFLAERLLRETDLATRRLRPADNKPFLFWTSSGVGPGSLLFERALL
jgi:hypothetical protein